MSDSSPGVSFGAAVLLMLTGAGLASGYAHYRAEALEQAIERTAPMAVVRLADFIEQMPANPTAVDTQALYQRYGQTVDRLAAAGYLVLDGQAVAGAPDDLYVPVTSNNGVPDGASTE